MRMKTLTDLPFIGQFFLIFGFAPLLDDEFPLDSLFRKFRVLKHLIISYIPPGIRCFPSHPRFYLALTLGAPVLWPCRTILRLICRLFGIDAVPAISCLGMCGSSTKNLKKQLGQHNCWIGHGGWFVWIVLSVFFWFKASRATTADVWCAFLWQGWSVNIRVNASPFHFQSLVSFSDLVWSKLCCF